MSKVQTDAFITKNNYEPPGKYSNNQKSNRSIHKSNVANNDLSSSIGDSIDDCVLVNKIINGVNSSLTVRKDNVEHMPTAGSGTQPQL